MLKTLPAFLLAVMEWQTAHPADLRVFQGNPSIPPLDSSVVMARQTQPVEAPGTHQTLSIIHEAMASSVVNHPWPLYVQLTTASTTGESVGVYSRVYSDGATWSAGLHAEEIIRQGKGTHVGVNVEQSPIQPGANVIGTNIQAKAGYSGMPANVWSQSAIQIQSDPGVGWDRGIRFDKTAVNTGIDLSTASGGTGIDVGGKFACPIKLGPDTCFGLDPNNPGRLIIMQAGKIVTVIRLTGQVTRKCVNC